MYLWLDDKRPPPAPIWEWVKSAPEALTLIRQGVCDAVSLDHDLGNEPYTGYWLLCQIEADVVMGRLLKLPILDVHTSNPVGRKNMLAAISAIKKFAGQSR